MIDFNDVFVALGDKKYIKELLDVTTIRTSKEDDAVTLNECYNSRFRFIKIDLNLHNVNVKYLNYSTNDKLKLQFIEENVSLETLLQTIVNRVSPKLKPEQKVLLQKTIKGLGVMPV